MLGLPTRIGAMVFLGCPFRMLQRLGGGDLNAWLALPGFVVGVGVARWFEQRGYSLGKTQEVPRPIGLLGPLVLFVPLLAWLAGAGLAGPAFGADGAVGPARAPWLLALGIALLGGGVLSATGFCAISAARSLFGGQRWMLWAALAFVLGYALAALVGGRWHASFDGQPIAHGDWLWNTLALLLVGLCGAFAGGCPVRQLVMAGEGNGDALVGCAGLVLGAALAHNLGIAAAAAGPGGAVGPGAAAPAAILGLLLAVLGYAAAMSRRSVVAS